MVEASLRKRGSVFRVYDATKQIFRGGGRLIMAVALAGFWPSGDHRFINLGEAQVP
jgi:hypothetical protein